MQNSSQSANSLPCSLHFSVFHLLYVFILLCLPSAAQRSVCSCWSCYYCYFQLTSSNMMTTMMLKINALHFVAIYCHISAHCGAKKLLKKNEPKELSHILLFFSGNSTSYPKVVEKSSTFVDFKGMLLVSLPLLQNQQYNNKVCISSRKQN